MRVVVVGIGGVRVGVVMMVVLAQAGGLVLVASMGVGVLVVMVPLVAVIHVGLFGRVVHLLGEILGSRRELAASAGGRGEDPTHHEDGGGGDPRSQRSTHF